MLSAALAANVEYSKGTFGKAYTNCLIKKSVFMAGSLDIFPLLLPIGLVATDLQQGPD